MRILWAKAATDVSRTAPADLPECRIAHGDSRAAGGIRDLTARKRTLHPRSACEDKALGSEEK